MPEYSLIVLERRSCCKFPATFVQPATQLKSRFFMRLSPVLCVGFRMSQEVRNMFKRKYNRCFLFMFFPHLFQILLRAFFTLDCRKETKHVKTVRELFNIELCHFSLRLATETDKTLATLVSHPFFRATWLSLTNSLVYALVHQHGFIGSIRGQNETKRNRKMGVT